MENCASNRIFTFSVTLLRFRLNCYAALESFQHRWVFALAHYWTKCDTFCMGQTACLSIQPLRSFFFFFWWTSLLAISKLYLFSQLISRFQMIHCTLCWQKKKKWTDKKINATFMGFVHKIRTVWMSAEPSNKTG